MWRTNEVNKAYKFRIYPNREQKEFFAKTFGCVRFIQIVKRKLSALAEK